MRDLDVADRLWRQRGEFSAEDAAVIADGLKPALRIKIRTRRVLGSRNERSPQLSTAALTRPHGDGIEQRVLDLFAEHAAAHEKGIDLGACAVGLRDGQAAPTVFSKTIAHGHQ